MIKKTLSILMDIQNQDIRQNYLILNKEIQKNPLWNN